MFTLGGALVLAKSILWYKSYLGSILIINKNHINKQQKIYHIGEYMSIFNHLY